MAAERVAWPHHSTYSKLDRLRFPVRGCERKDQGCLREKHRKLDGAVGRHAGHSNDDALALVYAKHPEYSRETIERHFGDIGRGDPRLRTCTVQEQMDVPPLQAADLVAYEMSHAQRGDGQERYPFLRLKAGLKQFRLKERFAGEVKGKDAGRSDQTERPGIGRGDTPASVGGDS